MLLQQQLTRWRTRHTGLPQIDDMIKNDEEGIACRYYYLKIVATFHNFVVIKNAILGQALVVTLLYKKLL